MHINKLCSLVEMWLQQNVGLISVKCYGTSLHTVVGDKSGNVTMTTINFVDVTSLYTRVYDNCVSYNTTHLLNKRYLLYNICI